MPDYRIEILPTHYEVTLSARIDRVLLARILEELAAAPGFPNRNTIWILENSVELPAFDEFDGLVDELSRFLPPDMVTRRAALVASPGMITSVLELWRTAASRLPLQLEIFHDYDNAIHFVT